MALMLIMCSAVAMYLENGLKESLLVPTCGLVILVAATIPGDFVSKVSTPSPPCLGSNCFEIKLSAVVRKLWQTYMSSRHGTVLQPGPDFALAMLACGCIVSNACLTCDAGHHT